MSRVKRGFKGSGVQGSGVQRSEFSVQERIKSDGLLRNLKMSFKVIPEQAGIQEIQEVLDSRLRGSDSFGDFLQVHQINLRRYHGKSYLVRLARSFLPPEH
jgi:hypothetical protein